MNHKSNAAYRVCEREYFQIRNRNKTKTKQGIIATTFLGYLSVVFGRKQAKLLALPQKHFHLLVAAAVADKRISTQIATPTHTHTHPYIPTPTHTYIYNISAAAGATCSKLLRWQRVRPNLWPTPSR